MNDLLALITFAIIATISPGGATTLATASGTRFGIARSLPLLAGISFGLAGLMIIVGAGLGSLILQYPSAQLALRIVGSAYLLWLGVMIMRQGAPKKGGGPEQPMKFANGVLLLWLNPKAWTMATAAVIAYSGLASNALGLGIILGAVFLLASGFSTFLWCAVGSSLARWLKTDRAWHTVNIALGLLLALSVIPLWL